MATAAKESSSTAVATVEQPRTLHLMRPIAEPAAVIEAQNATRDMVHQALKDGRDYGVIPGTDKPTLLKPGAERVALAFGCYYGEPIILEREIEHDREVKWVKRRKKWKNRHRGDREFDWIEETGTSLGLYRYVVKVPVINRATNEVVGAGVGSCSSMESKYVDRPRDSENTILKMAHKRALVSACLVTFGLSDEFTQDVEDLQQATESSTSSTPAAAPVPPEDAEPEDPYAGVDPEAITLEQALTLPLYGRPESWGKFGTQPLHLVPPKVLQKAVHWFADKLQEGDLEDASRTRMAIMVAAIRLVLENANKDQEKLPLEEKPAAAAAPEQQPGKPGKVQDAIAKDTKSVSVVALTKRLGKLLENAKLSRAQKAEIRRMLDSKELGTSKDMLAQIERIEHDVSLNDDPYGF